MRVKLNHVSYANSYIVIFFFCYPEKCVDPTITRRCRQVAKVLSKSEKLLNWYSSPEGAMQPSEDFSSKTQKTSFLSKFTRGPIQPSETSSVRSGRKWLNLLRVSLILFFFIKRIHIWLVVLILIVEHHCLTSFVHS